MTARAARGLVTAQNADGGWGARPGRSSATEPTAMAVLALSAMASVAARSSVTRGVQWLRASQRPDGHWPVSTRVSEPSWATSLAAFALLKVDGDVGRLERAAGWLVGQRTAEPGWVVRIVHAIAPGAMTVRVNPTLRGWPWLAGTSGFVEPTAYALFALRMALREQPPAGLGLRIREAEEMLYDRMCPGGGWNYGNSYVLGEALSPFADVTALALIALQHRAGDARTRQSLERLPELMTAARSGLALALGTICLALHGADVTAWQGLLVRRFAETGFLGETRAVALGLIALASPRGIFRL